MQKTSKEIIAVSIAVAAVIVGLLLVIPTVQYSTNNVSTGLSSSKTVYFTIIESDRGNYEGMNGSALHLGQAWPVMEVNVGDTVIIHIISEDASEIHGFTIVHYFDPGVALLPGGQYTVKFVASQTGTFLVTCLIFCAIHPLMDYGKFIVNASNS